MEQFHFSDLGFRTVQAGDAHSWEKCRSRALLSCVLSQLFAKLAGQSGVRVDIVVNLSDLHLVLCESAD